MQQLADQRGGGQPRRPGEHRRFDGNGPDNGHRSASNDRAVNLFLDSPRANGEASLDIGFSLDAGFVLKRARFGLVKQEQEALSIEAGDITDFVVLSQSAFDALECIRGHSKCRTGSIQTGGCRRLGNRHHALGYTYLALTPPFAARLCCRLNKHFGRIQHRRRSLGDRYSLVRQLFGLGLSSCGFLGFGIALRFKSPESGTIDVEGCYLAMVLVDLSFECLDFTTTCGNLLFHFSGDRFQFVDADERFDCRTLGVGNFHFALGEIETVDETLVSKPPDIVDGLRDFLNTLCQRRRRAGLFQADALPARIVNLPRDCEFPVITRKKSDCDGSGVLSPADHAAYLVRPQGKRSPE